MEFSILEEFIWVNGSNLRWKDMEQLRLMIGIHILANKRLELQTVMELDGKMEHFTKGNLKWEKKKVLQSKR
jgi:hypothetical protein